MNRCKIMVLTIIKTPRITGLRTLDTKQWLFGTHPLNQRKLSLSFAFCFYFPPKAGKYLIGFVCPSVCPQKT